MYRSGYNGADSKSVREQSLGGSNPSISATTTKLLPDHIEFSPNIAPVCPSFDDLISFDGIINGECRDLRMAGNGYLKDKKFTPLN